MLEMRNVGDGVLLVREEYPDEGAMSIQSRSQRGLNEEEEEESISDIGLLGSDTK